MDGERREREELARLDALFRADAGPSPSDVAEARLMLKRALARDGNAGAVPDASHDSSHGFSPRARSLFASSRALRVASQAIGFALLVALLVPVLPRILPDEGYRRGTVDLVANLADEARSVRERITPWLPSLPPLPLPSPSMALELRSGGPASGLFDWIPSLHSDAR